MKVVTLRTFDDVERAAPFWGPFLLGVAENSHETPDEMAEQLRSGEVQAHLVWDEDGREFVALCGTRVVKQGGKLIGDLVWCTGRDMPRWADLVADVVRYLKDEVGCGPVRAFSRPGWAPLLKKHGFKLSHMVMELK